jgi:hypothetical protein
MFLSIIYAGSGIPKHWFGTGEDVNRASALEMGSPVLKKLAARQALIKAYFKDICQFVLDQKRIFTDELKGVLWWDFDIEAPEIAVRDDAMAAQSLTAKIDALSAAKLAGAIDAMQLSQAVQDCLADSGIKIPPPDPNALTNTNGLPPLTPPALRPSPPLGNPLLSSYRRIMNES